MRTILHILTRPQDAFARQLIERQSQLGETTTEVVDVTAPEADYAALVDKIFAADSVQVW